MTMGNAAGLEAPGNRKQLQGSLSKNYLDNLVERLHVSHDEVMVLYKRFLQLGPKSRGLVDRSAFECPPYSDPFCRQIWMRIPGERDNQSKFSFFNFAKTMAWWQNASQESKLEVIFSWMKNNDGLSPPALAKIIVHTESTSKEEELLTMAEQVVELMMENTGSMQSATARLVTTDAFMNWSERIPQEKLKKSLEFKIVKRALDSQ